MIPGLGRSPGEGQGYPLQYSGLENSMDCTVHEMAKSRTQLSDFHSDFPPPGPDTVQNLHQARSELALFIVNVHTSANLSGQAQEKQLHPGP